MKAFERFLEDNPAWRGKATLLQVTPAREADDNAFSEIEAEAAGLIARINGRFGDAAWTPIRYVSRTYSRGALAGLYRLADAILVTPLRAGMGLVAKEFVAAQDPEDPGVLVLSQFAGAANELDRALIVNPHETDGVAAALKRALDMPLRGAARASTRRCSTASWTGTSRRWAESYPVGAGRDPIRARNVRRPSLVLRHVRRAEIRRRPVSGRALFIRARAASARAG